MSQKNICRLFILTMMRRGVAQKTFIYTDELEFSPEPGRARRACGLWEFIISTHTADVGGNINSSLCEKRNTLGRAFPLRGRW